MNTIVQISASADALYALCKDGSIHMLPQGAISTLGWVQLPTIMSNNNSRSHPDRFFSDVDWKLLEEQTQFLVEHELKDIRAKGLLHMIDYMEDIAMDMGLVTYEEDDRG